MKFFYAVAFLITVNCAVQNFQNNPRNPFKQRLVTKTKYLSSSFLRTTANRIFQILKPSVRKSLFEQQVEDVNSLHKMDNYLTRTLIVMPLSEEFRPNQADAMHGKVQYGDKCSLPSSLGRLIFEKRLEVPWIFEVVPVQRRNNAKIPSCRTDLCETHQKSLEKAYVSPLDFRAPENYIFLPRWVINDLGLEINDLVVVSFIRIKLASLVVLQPLSIEWDDLIKQYSDPKPILEHEINKYSSLTACSTICISFNGKRCSFYVKETYAEGGIKVHGVRVQDSDIRTDIDRSILDELLANRNLHLNEK